jgi:N-acetylglucosaminyldiphosphoundecaprenol N-acetyl-beta-D-mannosaminyltransferase
MSIASKCQIAPPLSKHLRGNKVQRLMRSLGARPAIAILGVPFDNVTTAEAIGSIERMIQSNQPHYVVTANVDFLVQARSDIELRTILIEAHMVLCDGTPLLWASKLLGNPLPERVAGADLAPLLIRVAERKRYRLFLLGATPDSVDRAVANLRRDHPDLLIAGHYSPPFRPLLEMDHDEIKRRILEARPDLLFVSFGCPKQEKWISMHYRQLGVPVAIGVGATIDFLAGQVRRAPLWMQRSGLEWIFRLAQEPRRLFRRYFKDLWVFGSSILAQWWHLRFRPRRRGNSQTRTPFLLEPRWQCVKTPDCLDLAAACDCSNLPAEVVVDGRDCLLDLSDVIFVDSTGITLLLRLQKELRAIGARLLLLNPSLPARRALKLMRLEQFFVTAPDLETAQQVLETLEAEQTAVALPPPGSPDPLRWQGEITAANAEEVWRQTCTHLSVAAPQGCALLDLSSVRFIDSSGLGLMIRARKFAASHGTHLVFVAPPPAVRNVIRIARLDGFLLGGTKN